MTRGQLTQLASLEVLVYLMLSYGHNLMCVGESSVAMCSPYCRMMVVERCLLERKFCRLGKAILMYFDVDVGVVNLLVKAFQG
jgi:hypothetical protein